MYYHYTTNLIAEWGRGGKDSFSGKARILDEKGVVQEAIALFSETYGKKMMDSYYPRREAAIEVPLLPT